MGQTFSKTIQDNDNESSQTDKEKINKPITSKNKKWSNICVTNEYQ